MGRIFRLHILVEYPGWISCMMHHCSTDHRGCMMHSCSPGELFARSAFMQNENQGHDALRYHVILKGFIFMGSIFCLDILVEYPGWISCMMHQCSTDYRVCMMHECSPGELFARAIFMHNHDQGHDALWYHAILEGFIYIWVG